METTIYHLLQVMRVCCGGVIIAQVLVDFYRRKETCQWRIRAVKRDTMTVHKTVASGDRSNGHTQPFKRIHHVSIPDITKGHVATDQHLCKIINKRISLSKS